ncbi:MAG: Fic family protein [Candidatus Sulfotelmatobacter sp.]
MPDWDEDSPRLRRNLTLILEEIAVRADERKTPTVETSKHWQRLFMEGLYAEPRYVGAFRGEVGLEDIGVRVGNYYGVHPSQVAAELRRFEETLQAVVAQLDKDLPIGKEPDADELAAVIDLCAWAHAEWVRIHPFANGSGRTARLWVNFLARRYGLPPFVRLRPRPDSGYEDAGVKAMQGDWKPTVVVFRRLFDRFLDEFTG